MNEKKLIEELNAKGAKFSIYTDCAYGRGINGIGYDSYGMHEVLGSDGNPKTNIYRTFEPKDDYLLIIEEVVPPEIPWNRKAEKKPYTMKKYIGYDRITYISEVVEG